MRETTGVQILESTKKLVEKELALLIGDSVDDVAEVGVHVWVDFEERGVLQVKGHRHKYIFVIKQSRQSHFPESMLCQTSNSLHHHLLSSRFIYCQHHLS